MHRRIAGTLTGPVTKWLVFAFWIIVLVVAVPMATKLSDVQQNDAKSWLPASAESTKAMDKLAAFQDPHDIPTTLVYNRPSGITAADQKTIADRVAQVAKLDGAVPTKAPDGTALPPQALVQVSHDGELATATVSFDFGKKGWNKLPATVTKIRDIADIPGAELHIAGPGGQAADSAAAFSGLDGKLLGFSLLVVIVILLFTYRSPVLWLLPVISAVVALFSAQAVVYLLADHAGLTVNGQSQGILTVLVFGAGTDYALLLVARYREELRRHENKHEAMAFALHRAAPAIIASALTVVLGMLCLVFAEMNSTAGLGPVAAIGIGVGLLVMITLLPALLVLTGRWVFWPARPRFGTPEPTSSGLWSRVGKGIARRPRTVWVLTAVVLGLCAIGTLKLDVHTLSTEESYTKDFDSIIGQNLINQHGLVDNSSPLLVVADAAKGPDVAAALADVDGLGTPTPPFAKDGIAFVTAPLTSDPTSDAAFQTVVRARNAVHAVPGAHTLVGGSTAVNADVAKASAHDNRLIIPLVLLVVLLILMGLLRAVTAPVLLIATVVLSFGASLGLSALLFHYIFGFAGADYALPLFVFVFLVALGIDYNIFLMTRVREETPAHGTRRAALIALGATGGVITSAGLVLAATFLVLGTMPLVAFAEIGVAVALGVMLDTLVVRSVLVTALNLDLGHHVWWPSKLDRGQRCHDLRAQEAAELDELPV